MEQKEDFQMKFMKLAVDISIDSVRHGGGPFGAVIVRNGEILAVSSNSVTLDADPTAHAEINAIRKACRRLGTFRLDGCSIYSSCEPCPMCLSAIYWAGIERIYYGNTKEDAAAIHFSDKFIYDELGKQPLLRTVPMVHIEDTGAGQAFEEWSAKEDKVEY